MLFRSAVRNAVGALCDLAPVKLLPRVISHVTKGLSNPALLQVTREEYDIMLTPEGELHDNSIIQKYSPPPHTHTHTHTHTCPPHRAVEARR